MSLIAEALRKAHLEAKQRDAARKGGAPYIPGAGTAVRPGGAQGASRARWVAALVASNLLLAAGAVGVYLALRASDEPAAAASIESPSPAVPAAVVAASAGAAPAAVEPPPAPAPEAVEEEAMPVAEAAAPTRAAPIPAAAPSEPSAAAEPTPKPVASGSSPRPAAAAPERVPARYTYGLTLLDGRRIELNGVVGAAGSNRAMINDRLLGVGDSVEGFEVVRIDRRGVALRSGERSVYIEIP